MTSYRQSMKDTLETMYAIREASLLERDLTPDEEKRREEIAKKLPDDDFKKRYGDKWMAVKMATATKMMKNEKIEIEIDDEDEDEDEEEKLIRPSGPMDEGKMSASQIAALKKAYEPMRGKKISMDSGNKLRSIMDKIDDDKQALIQLVKADIPFVSQLAITRLISKHDMKGAEINKLKEEVELDEAKYSYKAATFNGNVVKGTGKTKEAARKDAEDKAKALGSTIRKRLPEEVDLEEASAAADARRAMRRDPDMKQRAFSKDDSATDDDKKAASKNIMMQMRKAQSLGYFDVEFQDGKKIKIPAKLAIAVQQKYNAMRKPADKEKFQAKIAKSYRDMLNALKEEAVSPAQQAAIAISKKELGEKPKKESILDRIDRKIKENKNG